MPFRWSAGPGC
jgi:glutamine synthetase